MLLRITSTDEGLALEGELDVSTAEELGTHLHRDGTGQEPLVVDFSGVSFMDSSGLRVLLEAAGTRDADAPLVIVDPAPHVLRVIEISLPDGLPGLEVRSTSGAS